MKSRATRRFWKSFENLPAHAQVLARKNYELWRLNHQHPSLHFKKLKSSEDRFSIRIGDHYRAIGQIVDETVEWIWIGTHEDYSKLIR